MMSESRADDNKATLTVTIKRQDRPDAVPYWQSFALRRHPNRNVIALLQEIAATPVTTEGERVAPPVWEASCLEEVCGACTMLVNGFVRQACTALIDEFLEGHPHRASRPVQRPHRLAGTKSSFGEQNAITLEPMSKFPVVRDLLVDRSRMFRNLMRFRAWVPIDGLYDSGPGPRETPAAQEQRYALSRCMTCGCCLEACPQFALDNEFVGAQVFAQVLLFGLHNTGKQLEAQRLEPMSLRGGINDCGNAQNCVKVCPQELPLTEAIARIGQRITVHNVKRLFGSPGGMLVDT